MEEREIRKELEDLAAGVSSIEHALKRLSALGVESLGHTKIDHHRELRTGFPEVIYCESKLPLEVAEIAAALDARGARLLGTRCDRERFKAAAAKVDGLEYKERARLFFKRKPSRDDASGRMLIVCAGTSDLPVAEEAAWTGRMVGCHVETLFDVGVAGIHRLTEHADLLSWADAIVVCAGMEGALGSVVGGLVRCPVIAVPTSVGYGAAFEGVAALLGMLNSCAVGVSVVNIDNGFGAGLAAGRFARALGEAVKAEPQAENAKRATKVAEGDSE